VNTSLYYLQWKNIQQFVYLTCGLGFVPNLGNVTGKGGDLEITWRATDDLTLGINGAYTDSYYTGTQALSGAGEQVNLVTAGDHLPGLPEIRILSVRGGVRFDGMDLSLFAQNALNYHTPVFVSRDLATSVLNGYGTAQMPDNFDTNYFGRGYAPLTYGVTLTYRY
jgi:hypothetical protein